ncbi:hypothetical protein VOLCADRAFT_91062 [Volvox carteri f. nagariensis]|uniref:Uncharacterized protein n=1 Tax=Volvox carteri f. nagariensis TaxID=3068 RepID=D8TW29_VOLCA|nr:uncharacterized protein VOLCADRAFT_91062 [Volvox carteri f. nagariensis]EFJ48408.1 hypothetical protein VOLCADRAFT_91062 [Volvox carteri f. nagariensis]|eukprot:XP_002950662.1 hypothetical protein VOLCADRAFT_91062 [Volvox carteri f. nagariensis]
MLAQLPSNSKDNALLIVTSANCPDSLHSSVREYEDEDQRQQSDGSQSRRSDGAAEAAERALSSSLKNKRPHESYEKKSLNASRRLPTRPAINRHITGSSGDGVGTPVYHHTPISSPIYSHTRTISSPAIDTTATGAATVAVTDGITPRVPASRIPSLLSARDSGAETSRTFPNAPTPRVPATVVAVDSTASAGPTPRNDAMESSHQSSIVTCHGVFRPAQEPSNSSADRHRLSHLQIDQPAQLSTRTLNTARSRGLPSPPSSLPSPATSLRSPSSGGAAVAGRGGGGIHVAEEAAPNSCRTARSQGTASAADRPAVASPLHQSTHSQPRVQNPKTPPAKTSSCTNVGAVTSPQGLAAAAQGSAAKAAAAAASAAAAAAAATAAGSHQPAWNSSTSKGPTPGSGCNSNKAVLVPIPPVRPPRKPAEAGCSGGRSNPAVAAAISTVPTTGGRVQPAWAADRCLAAAAAASTIAAADGEAHLPATDTAKHFDKGHNDTAPPLAPRCHDASATADGAAGKVENMGKGRAREVEAPSSCGCILM